MTEKISKKILFIDDERDILQIAKEYLSDELLSQFDIRSFFVDNGQEGLKLATQDKYDLIFCDIVMPNFSGMDFLGKVKQQSNPNFTTPIIFFTGHIEETIDVKLDPSAFKHCYFMRKPVVKKKFTSTIHTILNGELDDPSKLKYIISLE